MHVDVSVAREHAEARLAAAVAAGGVVVDDSPAPAAWILADRAGNKVCIAAWPDGAADPQDAERPDPSGLDGRPGDPGHASGPWPDTDSAVALDREAPPGEREVEGRGDDDGAARVDPGTAAAEPEGVHTVEWDLRGIEVGAGRLGSRRVQSVAATPAPTVGGASSGGARNRDEVAHVDVARLVWPGPRHVQPVVWHVLRPRGRGERDGLDRDGLAGRRGRRGDRSEPAEWRGPATPRAGRQPALRSAVRAGRRGRSR